MDTVALGSVSQPAARAFQELQNGVRFFLNFLFHSDQLKEIKLRHHPSQIVTSRLEGRESAILAVVLLPWNS